MVAIYLVVTYLLQQNFFSCAGMMSRQYIKVASNKNPILFVLDEFN